MSTTSGRVHLAASCFLLLAIFSSNSLEESNFERLYESMVKVASYYVSDFTLSWSDSRQYCISLNRRLLSVSDVAKDEDLVSQFINGPFVLPGNAWTSGKERVEGVWNWDTGVNTSKAEPFYHTRWFVGQPDDLSNLNCVYLAKSALLYWRDANCSAPMYFICE